MTTSNTPESADDKKRRKAAERQAKKRKRDEALDMRRWDGKFSRGERAMIAEKAKACGFDDETEYLFSLVLTDVLVTE